ncbi:MAG: glycosyltransferase family 2 protein, partial [Flavobacteriaceae bacterium]|nr:glycosyltransferase family 2 protein [Flavobacteriaceae bacterium]
MINTAVVILNWNGLNLLKEFLPSVVKYSSSAKIYLADNASTDASTTWTIENFPQVKIINLAKNYGYAGGYNQALKEVEEDFCVLLNNDVEVSENWILPLVEVLKNNEKIAAVQPKIKDYKKPEYFEYAGAAGGLVDYFAYPYCRGRMFNQVEKDQGQYEQEEEIFWASGACIALKKSVFEKLGGFDEDYFAHMEEIDLCWRMKNAAFLIYYTPRAEVFHLGGGTLDNLSPKKTFLNFRNSLYNLVKNAPSRNIYFNIVLRLMLDGLAAIYFLLQLKPSYFWAVLKAHFSFYANFKTMKKKRNIPTTPPSYFNLRSII